MCLLGMPLVEKDHQLGRRQRMQRGVFGGGPPGESALGEAPPTQPKASSVIDQQFQRSGILVAENEQRTRERILLPLVPAERRQSVDALPKIDGFDSEENPQLRHQLQHVPTSGRKRCTALRLGSMAKLG